MWAFAMGPASVEGYPPFSVNIFIAGNAPMAGIFTMSNTLDAETVLDAGQWTQSFESTGGTAVGTFVAHRRHRGPLAAGWDRMAV